MGYKKDFCFDDLQLRGDIAFKLFKDVLDELDLLVSIQVKDEKKELIFSDKKAYLTKGDKRGVSANLKLLNMIIYENVGELQETILAKQQNDMVFINGLEQ